MKTITTNVFAVPVPFGQQWHAVTAGSLPTISIPAGGIAANYPMTTSSDIKYAWPQKNVTTTEVTAAGKMEISLRLVSNKVTKIEVESFELTERHGSVAQTGSRSTS